MAIAKVAGVSARSTDGSSVTTGSIDTTSATGIVIAVADFVSNAHTLSDSEGNTYDGSLTAYDDTGLGQIKLYFHKNPTTDAAHTFTVSSPGGNCFPAIVVVAFSGTDTATFYDGTQNGLGSASTSTTRQPGSITPSEDDCVVVSALVMAEPITATISGGGFSAVDDQEIFTGGQSLGVALAFAIQTTATATNPTWAWDGTLKTTCAAIAAFRAAASGGSTATPAQGALSLAGTTGRLGFTINLPDEA
jgi:hypothetical protein